MDLFKLVGTIAVNNEEANKAIDDTSGKAEQSHSRISGVFSKLGGVAVKAGQAIAVGIGAGATALTALSKSAIDNYAEYEQLVGGVETLFKSSSDKVIEYANNAYKTAGLSANDYMETVTGFSASLLQSLGGDTEKASEKANQAVIDMSDNANKMGTSMEAIQVAYQGFAKQNYTMLDNLKLGYGGTKEEMQRLLNDAEKISGIKYDISSFADVTDAIHVMQESMGIAGTTAKEASTTIQGSIGMMKSAWTNFLTGMADPSQDFDKLLGNLVDSVVTVADNLVPRIAMMLPRLVEGISQLVQKLATYIPDTLNQLLPALVEGATGLLSAFVTVLPQLIQTIVQILPQMLQGVVEIFNGIVQALPQMIQMICDALPALIPILIEGAVQMIVGICNALPQIIQSLIEALPTIIISIVTALLENLPALIQGLIQLTLGIVQALPQIIQAIIVALPTIITLVIQALLENLPLLIQGLIQLVAGIVVAIPQIIMALIQAIPTIITSIIEGFVPLGEGLQTLATNIMNGVRSVFENTWNAIKNVITTVMNAISSVISSVWEVIKNVVSTVVNAIKGVITTVWNNIKSIITNVLDGIKNTFSNVWNGIKNTVTNIIDGVKNTITNGLNGAKNTVTNVLNSIKDTFSNIFEGAKNIVSNAIETIKGFFNFEWSLPKIKLPHFNISGSFSLNPPSIPHFGVEWYKKAMDEPYMFTEPTLFGYNPATGSVKGAGEAGDEVMIGRNTMMDMIGQSVANENGGIVQAIEDMFNKLFDILETYFPEFTKEMVLDTGVLVAETAPMIDEELGKIYKRKGRS